MHHVDAVFPDSLGDLGFYLVTLYSVLIYERHVLAVPDAHFFGLAGVDPDFIFTVEPCEQRIVGGSGKRMRWMSAVQESKITLLGISHGGVSGYGVESVFLKIFAV